jgi:hypothetical protein
MEIKRKIIKKFESYGKNSTLVPKSVVIHNTASVTTTAKAYAERLQSPHVHKDGVAHYYVDENEIWQLINDDVKCWGSGDGPDGLGNGHSLQIEICKTLNKVGDRFLSDNQEKVFLLAEKRALMLAKYLMDKYNIPYNNVYLHRELYETACPYTSDLVHGKNNTKNFFISTIKSSKYKQTRVYANFGANSKYIGSRVYIDKGDYATRWSDINCTKQLGVKIDDTSYIIYEWKRRSDSAEFVRVESSEVGTCWICIKTSYENNVSRRIAGETFSVRAGSGASKYNGKRLYIDKGDFATRWSDVNCTTQRGGKVDDTSYIIYEWKRRSDMAEFVRVESTEVGTCWICIKANYETSISRRIA